MIRVKFGYAIKQELISFGENKMTQSFDEWFGKENPFNGNEDNEDCIWARRFMQLSYEAGAQSRQAEIDELQKRIDKALEIAGKKLNISFRDYLSLITILEGE